MNLLPIIAPHAPAEGKPAAPETRTQRFFVGVGLPIFLLAAVAIYEAFLLTLVFAPVDAGWWGGFALEFKIWCFSYDPRTGGMAWASVGMMLGEPLFVVGAAVLLWRRALQTLRTAAAWAAQVRPALAGVVVASLAIGTLFAFGGVRAEDEALPPFPGERIRTHLTPPSFRLVDQTGRECRLEDLRGRVVLVTGVYAACATTCPQILIDTRRLLDALPAGARARLSVVALSLNPEYETSDVMAGVASAYGFTHPEFRYLNGAPAVMHAVLDGLQFSRGRNPQTGAIDHANLLLLIDARGEIAYRFNLNPRHHAWLREAVLALTAEAGTGDAL